MAQTVPTKEYQLTERQCALVGWALRSKAADPRFYNQIMKQEVLKLAEYIDPDDKLQAEASIPHPTDRDGVV